MSSPQSSRLLANFPALKAKWPLFLIANMAILFVVGVSTIRETYRGWTVDHEIQTLEQKAQSLEGRRMELANLAQQMQTPQYLEREARAKLNLQKPGEHVVILEGVSATQTTWTMDMPVKQSETVIAYKSNPEQWWDYFTKGQ